MISRLVKLTTPSGRSMRPRAYWVPFGNCKTAGRSRARTSAAVRIVFDEKDPPPARRVL